MKRGFKKSLLLFLLIFLPVEAALEKPDNAVSGDYFPTIPDLSTVTTEHPHLFFTDADLPSIRNTYSNKYQKWNEPLFQYRSIYFEGTGSTDFSNPDYSEDDKAVNVFKLGFRCIMTESSSDCENAYNGLMNIFESNREDYSSAPGGILQRARALNNYVRAYDYTYDYIVENHPNNIDYIEDKLMGRALALVAMLNSDGYYWPYLQSSERHEVQMVVGLVALVLPHYERSNLTFCGKDSPTSCSQTYTYPDDAPAGWGSDVNSQDMLEYVMNGAFGTEPSSAVRSYSPDYFDAHFFNQKSRDGVEAGNAKEFHGQYLIYPFLFAWDNMFGSSNSLLYDLRAMADAHIELRTPDASMFNYQETPGDHFGHCFAGAYIADKYGGNAEKYFVYPKYVIDELGSRSQYEQKNLGDIYFSIWDDLNQAYENAEISDMYKAAASQSVIFPDGGIAVLRDGYESDDTMILLYANHKLNDKYGFGAHQGSWQMFGKGKYLTKNLNPASSTYISNLPKADPLQNDRLGGGCNPSTFAKSAAGANAILVDNYGARNVYRSNEMYDPANFVDNIFTADLDYVSMAVTYDEEHFTTSASCGHINPPESNGITVNRHFIFPKDYLIIIDETSGAFSSHEYSFNMWKGSGSVSEGTNRVTYTEGDSVLESYFITPVNITIYSQGLTKAKIGGVNPTFISVHYPRLSSEGGPIITTLAATGGKAGKIENNGATEIITLKEDSEVIADKIRTDALISFTRYTNPLEYFFIKDGSYFIYNNTTYLNSSENLIAVINYSSDKSTGAIEKLNGSTFNSVGIELYTETEPSSLSIEGSNIPFTYNNRMINFATSTFGDLIINIIPTETCNNIDDDNDDEIDEDLFRDCSLNYLGACAVGNEACSYGKWSGCPLPITESCNDIDDDCDGSIDEDNVCGGGGGGGGGGGSSGGGGGGRFTTTCTPNWQCTEWSNCKENGKSTRTCEDLSNCEGEKPPEERNCFYFNPKKPGKEKTQEEQETEKNEDIKIAKGQESQEKEGLKKVAGRAVDTRIDQLKHKKSIGVLIIVIIVAGGGFIFWKKMNMG